MSTLNLQLDKIAKRYGDVLFDLARKENALKAVEKDLALLEKSMEEEKATWVQIVSPSLSIYTQRRVIEKILTSLKLGKIMGRFLKVVCLNRRLPHLRHMLDAFRERVKNAEGIVEGILETAAVLSQTDLKKMEKALSAQFRKQIHLHQTLNKNLLGGIVLHIGSLMVDMSVKTQLDKLRTVMKG